LGEPQGLRKRCHPDRSEAQWRDLLFNVLVTN
jgi:hypothetical protein